LLFTSATAKSTGNGSHSPESGIEEMSESRLAAYKERLVDADVRVTRHRLKVLEVLAATSGHVTATEVLEEVRKRYPSVNKTTVYRILDLLVELGAATMTHMQVGDNQYNQFIYELTEHPHHHLICKDCGYVVELPDSTFESLRQTVQSQYGFRPTFDHFALYGVCEDCQKHPPSKVFLDRTDHPDHN
jgi:Fur family ferric uptake transcriptional regulator